MNVITRKLYPDTCILRYFATAFRDVDLDATLRPHLVMSSASVLELLGQLATDAADEAFAAIRALQRVCNSDSLGLLPLSDDAIRMGTFGLPAASDTFTQSLNDAVNHCLCAATAKDVYGDSLHLRGLLDRAKAQTAQEFDELLEARRKHGKLPEAQHREIFALSHAKRAGVPIEAVDVDRVIERLNALYVYEVRKLETVVRAKKYKPARHRNDMFDAEQLVHLCEPGLHFLTADRGFERATGSTQWDRIHIVEPAQLEDPVKATKVIGDILGS